MPAARSTTGASVVATQPCLAGNNLLIDLGLVGVRRAGIAFAGLRCGHLTVDRVLIPGCAGGAAGQGRPGPSEPFPGPLEFRGGQPKLLLGSFLDRGGLLAAGVGVFEEASPQLVQLLLADVGALVQPVGGGVPAFGAPVPFVGGSVPFIGGSVTSVRCPVALIGGPIALTPGDGSL